jgi:hypothetical protein
MKLPDSADCVCVQMPIIGSYVVPAFLPTAFLLCLKRKCLALGLWVGIGTSMVVGNRRRPLGMVKMSYAGGAVALRAGNSVA